MGRACSTHVQKRNANRFWVEKPQGKRSLRIPRCRQEDNINRHIRQIGWSSTEWIHLAQDRDQSGALVIRLNR
jgi:hypothetical protein